MSFGLATWFKGKSQRKLITPVTVGKLRFLAEQDGPVERDLKTQWLPILTAAPQIRRAFLVKCAYDQGDQHVVLVLCSTNAPDLGFLEAMRVPYARAFHRDCHLDMMFATATQESQIESVCPPFYTLV